MFSERAIASVIPAIPAPMVAILRGGEEEEPMLAIEGITVKSEEGRISRRGGGGKRFSGELLGWRDR